MAGTGVIAFPLGDSDPPVPCHVMSHACSLAAYTPSTDSIVSSSFSKLQL